MIVIYLYIYILFNSNGTTDSYILQSYLEAGADFVETNSFNGTSISQSDYGTQHLVRKRIIVFIYTGYTHAPNYIVSM